MRKYEDLTEEDKRDIVKRASELQKTDRSLVHSVEELDIDYRALVSLIKEYDFLSYEDSYVARRTLTRMANCIDKYGKKSNLVTPEVVAKNQEKLKDPSVIEKRKATNRERYGADYPWCSGTSCRKKYEDTMESKYGARSAFSKESEIRKSIEEKSLEDHGTSIAQWANLKGTETTREKYGVDYYFQSEEANKKILENLRKRGFGGPNSVHYGEETAKIISSKESLENFILSVDEKERYRSVLASKLGMSTSQFNYYLRTYELRKYLRNHNGSSIAELEIGDIIEEWGIDIVRRTRKIIPPYEIDIYAPEYKIGIEYDGNYWHEGRDEYHQMKSKMCKSSGVKLIHIKEDDYKSNPDEVVRSLFYEFGLDKKYNLVLSSQKESHELKEFYDIEVSDESHNFITTQGVVHNSVDTRQILSTKGFEVGYTSLDRTPDGYDGLRSAIYDRRIILLKGCNLLVEELSDIERDNMTRKYDHPTYGSKDSSDSLAGAFLDASKYKDEYIFFHPSDVQYEDINTNKSNMERDAEEMLNNFFVKQVPAYGGTIAKEEDDDEDYTFSGMYDDSILFF